MAQSQQQPTVLCGITHEIPRAGCIYGSGGINDTVVHAAVYKRFTGSVQASTVVNELL